MSIVLRKPTLFNTDSQNKKFIMPFSIQFPGVSLANLTSVTWNGQQFGGDLAEINFGSILTAANFGTTKSLTFSLSGFGYKQNTGAFVSESYVIFSPTSGQLIRVGKPYSSTTQPAPVLTSYIDGCIPFFVNQGSSFFVLRLFDGQPDFAFSGGVPAFGDFYAANYEMTPYLSQVSI